MKASILSLCFFSMGLLSAFAQTNPPATNSTSAEQEIITLSKDKWQWMADKNVDKLTALFDEKSMFVHMGGSWGKSRELEVIKSGNIWYKKASVYATTFNMIGNTAILLSDIDLVAVVGGNEVTNPFMVTEVYVKENGKWTMGQLSFSRLMRPVKN
ncbi:nuclear transport factor 2 family protein [Spirosoma sp. BT702]|uniref:Nuclear transport factor 2 family protein n=1 Tax=Spirosoma profusum TaxID=2771354 RepID=A0A926Y387_9BACT|nr:nuclear transport factor 2 family protein [Spirosoma profusum]MBD2701556.1 nuclear transport factor 2 family protein [Spirosoma profusum]